MNESLRPDTFSECLQMVVDWLDTGQKAIEMILPERKMGREMQDDLLRVAEGLRTHTAIDEILMDMMDELT